MITDIPRAKQYVLLPAEEPSAAILVGDARPCGALTFSQLLMTEIGKIIEDKDVIGVTGIGGERCMLIVNVKKEQLFKLLDGALTAVDLIFKEYPHIVPEGGIGFNVRDWEDIPDSEKAGNPANKK